MPKRKSASKKTPGLSKLELDVMDTVWELGECSSAQIVEDYQRKKRPLADTTIRTVLANLRKKGYVEPVPTIERGFRWKPMVSRDAVARRSLRELVGSLFRGSPQQAIAYLLNEEISDEELEQIERMIANRRSDETST